jgi:acyl dehydratase
VPRIVHVNELFDLAGQHLGHSDWHEITQHQVDLFADATWDHQWIHVDPARAAAGPYGRTIAHGFLIIALAPALLAEILQFDGIDVMVNRGLGELKLRAPVPVGARVRMAADLVSVRRRPRGYVETLVRLGFDSEVDGRRERAVVADLVVLLRVIDESALSSPPPPG